MDFLNLLLGFAVLTGPLWLILILLPACIWLAVKISKRFKTGITRLVGSAGIFLLLLALPFAALLFVMPVPKVFAEAGEARGADQEIGNTIEVVRAGSVGRVDSAVLAPIGERLYTLNDGVLRLYNLSPLGIISTKKMEFDTRQINEDPYRMFVTHNEKRIILYSKTRLRVLDLENGKIIKTVPFQSALGVLNGDELFTLDNDNKATVWNAYELTKIKEFEASASVEERWSREIYDWDRNVNINLTIDGGFLIKAASHIILHRPIISNASGQVFVFDSTSYRQIWNLKYLTGLPPTLSYDLDTLYVGTYRSQMWYLGKYVNHIEEFIKKNEGTQVGEILEIDIATAQVKSSMSRMYFQSSHYLLPTLLKDFYPHISPTRRYYGTGPAVGNAKNRYDFFYREKKLKVFLQFEDGEVALISNTGYFQGTHNVRKHLKMKNSKGEIVPINDATFEKFNKANVDHKEW